MAAKLKEDLGNKSSECLDKKQQKKKDKNFQEYYSSNNYLVLLGK